MEGLVSHHADKGQLALLVGAPPPVRQVCAITQPMAGKDDHRQPDALPPLRLPRVAAAIGA